MGESQSRRGFLANVGRATLVATVGSELSMDLGFTGRGFAGGPAPDSDTRLTFGSMESLVSLMQDTPVSRLLPTLVEQLKTGRSLRDLVAAAALANARTFGGEDYIGFHTMMALAPAYHMSEELPEARRALPVLKVLYRNTNRIAEFGGRSKEVLQIVENALCECCLPPGKSVGELLREAVRAKDMQRAEATFGALVEKPEDAFNAVLMAVQDNTEVHRTVMPYRAWDLLGIIGRDHADTLLRQSVHYCVKSEREWRHTPEMDRPRTILPRMMDEHKLQGKKLGDRKVDDAWIEKLCQTFFTSTPEAAADAAAAAIAEGIDPDAIGQALTLTANQLVLRDHGRYGNQIQPGKPAGSVHGDSIGVHASDSANAWRNMARVSNPRNAMACLILGAFQVADDRVNRGGDFIKWTPRPSAEDLAGVAKLEARELIGELPSAIRGNDQARAAALVHKIGTSEGDPARVFATLLDYAVSEDGALHAEKYYRTVREEFTNTRPAFRWRHLVALARVTASEYGRPAPGCEEARSLLKVV